MWPRLKQKRTDIADQTIGWLGFDRELLLQRQMDLFAIGRRGKPVDHEKLALALERQAEVVPGASEILDSLRTFGTKHANLIVPEIPGRGDHDQIRPPA